MKVAIILFVVSVSLIVPALSSYCSGSPKTLNGLPCASTTRYYDGLKGACGCGTGDTGGTTYSWQYNDYTAAASAPIFGTATWCGSGCGRCYKITPTGYTPTGGNACGSNCGKSIVIMVTNLCPENGNAQWCPTTGSNSYGYGAHFDLMDLNMDGKITALGWDNPEVTYQQVSCGTSGAPTTANFDTCQCG